MENPIRLTIILPCVLPGEGLSQTLQSLATEDLSSFELILVQIDEAFSLPFIPKGLSCHQLTIPGGNLNRAIEAGTQKASGNLTAIFRPGTQLLPGCLEEAETVFSKSPGLNVLVGQAICLDAEGKELGLKYPAIYRNHLSLLKIWQNDPPPLSAVFARTSVLRNLTYPKIDISEQWNEYNILCRITQNEKAAFHNIFLVALPLLPSDLLLLRTQEIDQGIQVSREYWKMNRLVVNWLMRISLLFYRLNIRGHGLTLLREAESYSKQRKRLFASLHFLAASFLSPKIVFITVIFPFFRDHFLRKIFKLFPGKSPDRLLLL